MKFEIDSASNGYFGHFAESDRESLSFQMRPGVIKFFGTTVLPYVCFDRSDSNFTIYGPWFSLLIETAKKLNYSLEGLAALPGASEEAIWIDWIRFLPDIVLIPFTAQFDSAMNSIGSGSSKHTRMVITAEMDHILSAKKFQAKNLMSLITPFDFTSLVLMATSLVWISLFGRYFKSKTSKPAFHDVIWFLASALIYPPLIATKKVPWRVVGLSWAFGVYLLHQVFSGDMFTAMTLPPDLDVVNSFDDLALHTSGPITAFGSLGADVNKYVSPYREHREALTSRIQILPAEHTFNKTVIEDVLVNVSTGNHFHLNSKHILELYKDVFFDGMYKDAVYISEEFGQPLPLFLFCSATVPKIIFTTFNIM